MLTKDVEKVRGMVASTREFIESLRNTEPAIWAMFQPDGGQSEVTCVWDEDGTLCRMRADRISSDRAIICDLKFTKRSAEPETQGRQALPAGKISAAWYRRGCEAVFGTSPAYVFLVTEMEPPYLCSLVGVDPESMAIGAEKVEFALREWQRCIASNRWPGYPAKVCYPETPAWERMQWEGRQMIAWSGLSYEERAELGSQP